MKARGRVCQKLAALLQKSFPTKGSFALTWSAEWLYPARGSWRSNKMLDVYAWEGFGKHIREDGSEIVMMSVGSYETMTELIKSDLLVMDSFGEVYAAELSKESL